MKFFSYLDALAHLRALDLPNRQLEVTPVRISTDLFAKIPRKNREMTYTQMDVWSHDLGRETSNVLGHVISGQSDKSQEWHALLNPIALAAYVTQANHALIDPKTGRAFAFTHVSGIREVDLEDIEVTEFFGTRESVLQLIANEREACVQYAGELNVSPADLADAIINRLIGRIKEGK